MLIAQQIRIRQILDMKSTSNGCGYWLALSHPYLSLIPSQEDRSSPRSSPGSSTGILDRFGSGDWAMTPAEPGRSPEMVHIDTRLLRNTQSIYSCRAENIAHKTASSLLEHCACICT